MHLYTCNHCTFHHNYTTTPGAPCDMGGRSRFDPSSHDNPGRCEQPNAFLWVAGLSVGGQRGRTRGGQSSDLKLQCAGENRCRSVGSEEVCGRSELIIIRETCLRSASPPWMRDHCASWYVHAVCSFLLHVLLHVELLIGGLIPATHCLLCCGSRLGSHFITPY